MKGGQDTSRILAPGPLPPETNLGTDLVVRENVSWSSCDGGDGACAFCACASCDTSTERGLRQKHCDGLWCAVQGGEGRGGEGRGGNDQAHVN